MYSATVRRLLLELPHRGTLPDPTASGHSRNPVCGDEIRIFLLIREGVIETVRFQAYGCPGALAAAAGLCEMLFGRSLEQSRALDRDRLLTYLDGLPAPKAHGCDLALEALRAALPPV